MERKGKKWSPFMMVAIVLIINGMELKAQDWPRWRGSDQDGISKEKGLNLDWSASKPSLVWTFRQAGMGYAAPTIVGTTLYCQGAVNEQGFAFALDTKNGSLKWKTDLGREYVEDRESAPRGSVTVDGDKLYLIRGIGQIHCLSAADGKVIWQKDFKADFKGKLMSRWGYSESPLIDGDLVICSPGGSDGTMVALDKNTGALVWRTKEWKDDAAHSSAIVVEIDGIRHYVQQANQSVAGISAKDGKILWKIEKPEYSARGAVIPTPIYNNDHIVYVTTGYNVGCTGIRLAKAGDGIKAETIYANKNIVNQHGGVVLMDGYVYGLSDVSSWVCQNLMTGETVWTQRNREGLVRGSILGIEGRLIILDERTNFIGVATASPEGWKEICRMEIPERTKIETKDNLLWPHPVIAHGNLYIRDHDLLFCFNLKK